MKFFLQITIFLLLFYILTANAAFHENLPYPESVPGGVYILTFHAQTLTCPKAYFQGHRLLLVTNKKNQLCYALIGIPLSTTPQIYFIRIFFGHHKIIKKQFLIKPKLYPVEYLQGNNLHTNNENIKPRGKLNINNLLWTNNAPLDLVFILPIRGKIIGDFGLQRFYNKQPRQPHDGLDIAAPFDSPVKASLDGDVVITAHYNDTGKTIILNHGRGLFTMYAHLNKIFVQKGQHIKTGSIIGSVGESGLVTQSHLHWSIILNKAFVDPKLFLPPCDFFCITKKI